MHTLEVQTAQAVQQRTLKLAHEAAKKAVDEVAPLFEALSDMFDVDLVEIAIERARERARHKKSSERQSGPWNDHHSSAPGMVLFLSPAGAAKMQHQARFGSTPATQYVSQLVAANEETGLMALHLPHGGYWQDNGGVDVFPNWPHDLEHDFAHSAAAFRGGNEDIVRMETLGGELVQNRHFQPDGTPITDFNKVIAYTF